MTPAQSTRNPCKFFLLTFVYSWIIWLPSVLDGLGVNLPFNVAGYSMVVVIIGAFAPLLAAITLVAREAGWKGIKAFFRQALDFLGQVVGDNITEDILSNIFSRFCIGK